MTPIVDEVEFQRRNWALAASYLGSNMRGKTGRNELIDE